MSKSGRKRKKSLIESMNEAALSIDPLANFEPTMLNKKKNAEQQQIIEEPAVVNFMTKEDYEEEAKELKKANSSMSKKKKDLSQTSAFATFGLHENLLRAVWKKGFRNPTPIQRRAIPVAIEGHDVVCMARTGSGKTAAFLLPLLHKLGRHSSTVGVKALVISPTRELAMQTTKFAHDLSKFTDLRVCLLVGGDSLEVQFSRLAENPDIVIGTPGRIMQIIQEANLSLNLCKTIVFDEADRLFESNFAEQLRYIFSRLPWQRQSFLVSATLPKMLAEFARADLRNPKFIRLDSEQKLSEFLSLSFFTGRPGDKAATLLWLMHSLPDCKATIIFAATRHRVEYLHQLLSLEGINSVHIYGSMDPDARKYAINRFRRDRVSVLVVTDVAARGIDIPLLDRVINFDLPSNPKIFLHRVGRVARAGRKGEAHTIVANDELAYMLDTFLFIGRDTVDEIKDTDSSEPFTWHPHTVLYGTMPQALLDVENEKIQRHLSKNSMLEQTKKSSDNAHSLYCSTRNAASPSSITRAKNLPLIKIHPIVKQMTPEISLKTAEQVSSLSSYRPRQTVFEYNRAKKGSEKDTAKAAEVMNQKRAFHEGAIFKEKIRKEKKEKDEMEQILDDKEEGIDLAKLNDLAKSFASSSSSSSSSTTNSKRKRTKDDFKDSEFFVPYEPSNNVNDKIYSVASGETINQSHILDLNPESAEDMHSSKEVKKWDRKRKRFVQVKAHVDVNSMTQQAKKARREASSGKADKKKKTNSYESWLKKSHKRIPNTGEEEAEGQRHSVTPSVYRGRVVTGRWQRTVPGLVKQKQLKKDNLSKEKAGKRAKNERRDGMPLSAAEIRKNRQVKNKKKFLQKKRKK